MRCCRVALPSLKVVLDIRLLNNNSFCLDGNKFPVGVLVTEKAFRIRTSGGENIYMYVSFV